ncbi:MAG: MBL fold metallo-hydrolase [Anaerolineae bacterium]
MCYSHTDLRGWCTVRLDRVAEDIFIFISSAYAHVSATVLFTPDGVVVVDTLPFPAESRQLVSFIDQRVGPDQTRYVIHTHHHADHVYGTYMFEGAEIIAHDNGRSVLEARGQASLAQAKRDVPALAEVELRLPTITFQREMHLHLGHRHLRLMHTPGHSSDGISVFVVEEKVLIAGDAVMPVPYIARGSYQQMIATLTRIKALKPAFIVQGHGDVLLRGEVDETIDSSITYLHAIAARVRLLVERGEPAEKLKDIDIEACGKSRVPLDGLVSNLHQDNLLALYKAMTQARRPS